MKTIGPLFFDELVAHGGLIGEHFTWSPDGTIEFFEDTPENVAQAVLAVYDAHDPGRLSIAGISEKICTLGANADAATSGMANAFIAGLLNAQDEITFLAAYQLALSKVDQQPGYPVAINCPVSPA
jgi:hypothetical protein